MHSFRMCISFWFYNLDLTYLKINSPFSWIPLQHFHFSFEITFVSYGTCVSTRWIMYSHFTFEIEWFIWNFIFGLCHRIHFLGVDFLEISCLLVAWEDPRNEVSTMVRCKSFFYKSSFFVSMRDFSLFWKYPLPFL